MKVNNKIMKNQKYFLYILIIIFIILIIKLKNNKNSNQLHTHKTYLKYIPSKYGKGVFASRKIKQGEIITIMPLKVINRRSKEAIKMKDYVIGLSMKYKGSNNLIASPYIEKTENYISNDGMYCNEPSINQESNSGVRPIYESWTLLPNKLKIQTGEKYKLAVIATKDIEKDKEITWCYGPLYNRNYKTNCSEHNKKFMKNVFPKLLQYHQGHQGN